MASLFWSFVVLVILAIPLTLAARLTFNLRGPKYSCRESTTPEKLSWVSSASPKFSKDGFTTNTPCWPSGAAVEKETAYRLTIEITEPWLDGTILTDAGGYWPEFPWGHFFDKPRLRWPSAGAFQPIARIGLKGGVEWPLVSKDGAGPLQSGVEKCTRMPIPYERTEAYCAAHGFPPTDNYKSCWEAPALLGANGFVASLFGSDPLAAAERAMVAKAWNDPAGVWRYDEKPNKCVSAHPRKTFVSEFVAMHTGELFLFVNDMIPPFGLGGARAHYRNNLGAAKITLEPVPLAGPEVK